MKRLKIFFYLCVVAFMTASAQGVLDLPDKVEKVTSRLAANEHNGHKFVDLGLSVKWADCNIGAKSVSEAGDYFAWGEVKPKGNYSEQNSATRGIILNTDNGMKDKDAANINWGGNWRLPTPDDMKELFTHCEWTWTELDGINGYKIIGPNGNTIFLPAVGKKKGDSVLRKNIDGMYSTSGTFEHTQEIARQMNFDNHWHWITWINRYEGLPVRPVLD